ncbi:uncharacterized PE-PGRS family protein PE_PGRS3-like [Pollicipes pollicipes]|uniref:uncharacterized PE-PGRS family protein PE_PGRS3-like n=1 Tax=Pollicipes pollicipes TaxID=41117 RepID=UPI001884BA1C|nr:uncharacterized PE-PGRS family protein PE_PGRS3-like [Pollicipes pollicipes]
MLRSGMLTLACLAVAHALPFDPFSFFPPSTATGTSSGTITSGETVGQSGASRVEQLQAGTGGRTEGGGFNFGNAFATQQREAGLLGNANAADTGATSVQETSPIGGGFPVGFPGGFPDGFPAFKNPFGTAEGKANAALTTGETVNIDGSRSKITSLGSSAGGSAENGGISISGASGKTSSTDGIFGSTDSSEVKAESVQAGGR